MGGEGREKEKRKGKRNWERKGERKRRERGRELGGEGREKEKRKGKRNWGRKGERKRRERGKIKSGREGEEMKRDIYALQRYSVFIISPQKMIEKMVIIFHKFAAKVICTRVDTNRKIDIPYRYKYKDKISRGRGIPRYWAGNTHVMAVSIIFLSARWWFKSCSSISGCRWVTSFGCDVGVYI